MREMDLSQLPRSNNKLRSQIIVTSASTKPRSEEEKSLLMRSAYNRFWRSVEEGKIVIHSKTEWTLK